MITLMIFAIYNLIRISISMKLLSIREKGHTDAEDTP